MLNAKQDEIASLNLKRRSISRSGVEDPAALLCEASAWRMRLIELALASVIFFWLGFWIAVRCL